MRFLGFLGGRLLRAAVSLLLFQIILFALIQALPQHYAEMRIAVFSQGDLSQFEASDAEDPEETSQAEGPAPDLGDDTGLAPDLGDESSLPIASGDNPGGNTGFAIQLGEDFGEPAPDPVGPSPELGEPSAEEAPAESVLEEEPSPVEVLPPPDTKVGLFVHWMTRFYQGDLGVSSDPIKGAVADILAQRLPKSLFLLLPATVVGFLLGLWLGKLIAWRRRGWLEFAATLGGTAFYTSFPPWLAFVAISVVAFSLKLLPPEKLIDPLKWLEVDLTLNQVIVRLLLTMGAAGIAYALVEWLANKYAWYRGFIRAGGAALVLILASIPWVVSGLSTQAVDLLYHLALPFFTLVLLSFGETMLVMRTTMVEAMEADHVPVALARGLPESTVRDRHVARIAILPVLARFIVHLPLVMVGSFVIERVFFWDGMGQVMITAARDNDLPILLGVLSIAAVGILVAHVILDVLTNWLDPRLRRAKA